MPKSKNSEIRFTKPGEGAPENLVAAAEVAVSNGLLAGVSITDIRVWQKKEDVKALQVTFPSKRYEADGETRY